MSTPQFWSVVWGINHEISEISLMPIAWSILRQANADTTRRNLWKNSQSDNELFYTTFFEFSRSVRHCDRQHSGRGRKQTHQSRRTHSAGWSLLGLPCHSSPCISIINLLWPDDSFSVERIRSCVHVFRRKAEILGIRIERFQKNFDILASIVIHHHRNTKKNKTDEIVNVNDSSLLLLVISIVPTLW